MTRTIIKIGIDAGGALALLDEAGGAVEDMPISRDGPLLALPRSPPCPIGEAMRA